MIVLYISFSTALKLSMVSYIAYINMKSYINLPNTGGSLAKEKSGLVLGIPWDSNPQLKIGSLNG